MEVSPRGTLKKGDLYFKANEYMKCLPEHMMRNRHPVKNLANCFRLAQQDTLETPKWAPSPGLSMSWTSFASSPEASNQDLPVQPGTVWYPEEQVSGNAASPENIVLTHSMVLEYQIGKLCLHQHTFQQNPPQ